MRRPLLKVRLDEAVAVITDRKHVSVPSLSVTEFCVRFLNPQVIKVSLNKKSQPFNVCFDLQLSAFSCCGSSCS